MGASERLRECIPDLDGDSARGLVAEAWSRMGPVRRELYLRQPALRSAYASAQGVDARDVPRLPPVERILERSPPIVLLRALMEEAIEALDELQLEEVASSDAAVDALGSGGPTP